MRIGILTFHRAYNYGAVLQCYALQQYLLSQGHKVEVIDYMQPWVDACFKPFSMIMFRYNLHHPKLMYRFFALYDKRKKMLAKRKTIFTTFCSKYLLISSEHFTEKEKMPQDYDAYIIGSDQLWGILCLGGKFDDVYLGLFPHKENAKVIGFSISSDINSINILAEAGRLNSILKCFSAISFREKNIADKVSSITNTTIPVTVDPTLLADEQLWVSLIDNKWKSLDYVVIYQVRGITKNKSMLYEKASRIASMIGKNCKIIDLSDMSYSVTDFVSIIKYAKFVITTSFHATVFSIIFKTPFYVIKLNDGRDNRYVDLCCSLGLSKQCIDVGEKKLVVSVDFSQVGERLLEFNQLSRSYIHNNLSI